MYCTALKNINDSSVGCQKLCLNLYPVTKGFGYCTSTTPEIIEHTYKTIQYWLENDLLC